MFVFGSKSAEVYNFFTLSSNQFFRNIILQPVWKSTLTYGKEDKSALSFLGAASLATYAPVSKVVSGFFSENSSQFFEDWAEIFLGFWKI